MAPGNTSVSITADVKVKEVGTKDPALRRVQSTTNLLETLLQMQGSEAPGSSDARKSIFGDAIARILIPLTRNSKMDPSKDSSADLSFLKTMVAGFKDVQEHYCRCQNRRISGRGSRTVRLRSMATGDKGHDVYPGSGPLYGGNTLLLA